MLDAWHEKRFVLVSASAQLDELSRATRYPKIRKRIKAAEAGRLINDLRALAVQIRNIPSIRASPDSDDDFLLGIASAAKAERLVTGDRSGLLVLQRFRDVRIVSVSEFCNELQLSANRGSVPGARQSS